MSNFFRIGFTAIALTIVLSTFGAIKTNAQIINEVLKRMDTYYAKLKTLRSDIKMVKYNKDLGTDDSDIYEGKLMYLPEKGRSALVRIDWSKPVETFSVVDKEYVVYRPRLNQALTGNVNNAKGSAGANSPLAFINMSKTQLKANFDIKYLGQESVGGTQTWHLELTPKKSAKYKKSDIWVNGNGLPIQIKTTENNNDSTTISLTNINDSANINRADFKINLPSGTKIVK